MVVNKAIIRNFTGCASSVTVISIVFDDLGYLAISCETQNSVKLYYSNGTSAGKSLSTATNPAYGGFDSKGRFVVLSQLKISI